MLTGNGLKSLVGVVSKKGLVIFVLLTGANELSLVCRDQRHNELTLAAPCFGDRPHKSVHGHSNATMSNRK